MGFMVLRDYLEERMPSQANAGMSLFFDYPYRVNIVFIFSLTQASSQCYHLKRLGTYGQWPFFKGRG
jgi:hypothetical protein